MNPFIFSLTKHDPSYLDKDFFILFDSSNKKKKEIDLRSKRNISDHINFKQNKI